MIKNRWDDRPRQYYEFGAFQSRGAKLDIWATNSTLQAKKVTLELHAYDLEQPSWRWSRTDELVLLANQTTEHLLKFDVPYPPERAPEPQGENEDPPFTPTWSVVTYAILRDAETGTVLSRIADWPQPYRYITFPDPGLRISKGDGETLKVEASSSPLKGLVFSAVGEGREVKWSDNGLDLWPGDVQVVGARGLNDRKVCVQYLGSEHGQVISV